MFEKFTERGRKVIIYAREEAEKRQNDYLGTEHLLLGLLREEESLPMVILKKMGLSAEELRMEVERNLPTGSNILTFGDIPFTPRAKKVLELAVEEARLLGHSYIGSEHLLIGLIREDAGIAGKILRSLGANLLGVRQLAINLSMRKAQSGGKDKKSHTPALDEFGRDVTQLAREGKLDPVVGRETEIERVLQILGRRVKNNPVIIGESGVGKTAIVEGLAQRIIAEEKSNIQTNESGNPVTGKMKTPEADPPDPVSPALDEQWNLKNLAKSDYKIEADKIIFLATPNIKKALYQTTVLSDFNVHMEARIRNNNAAGRFGIIVGYRTMKDSPYEIYYLLSLFRQQEFLLQKYSAFRKELVTRIPINFDSLGDGFQDIQLEVKCSGPFIELHANQKQVFRWNTGEELVSGQVGVFVSPETEVEVSKFEIAKGTEFSRK